MLHLISRSLSRFISDESGATSIEYALIATGIGMAIIVTVQGLGSTVAGRYTAVSASLK